MNPGPAATPTDQGNPGSGVKSVEFDFTHVPAGRPGGTPPQAGPPEGQTFEPRPIPSVAPTPPPVLKPTPAPRPATAAGLPPRKPGFRDYWEKDRPWLIKAGIGMSVLTLILTVGATFGINAFNHLQASATKPGDKVPIFMGGVMKPVINQKPASTFFGGKEQVLFILTGIDQVKYLSLTDSILCCLIDFGDHRVKILSIPRDTLVPRGKSSWGRINESAALRGDLTGLKDAVGDFLTVPVDNVVAVNYEGFKKVVDAFGGVDVNVPKKLKYSDKAGKLNIDFRPGPTHLDGQAAMEYCRFRHDAEGDFGRIRRQQQFLTEFKRQKLDLRRNPMLVGQLPNVIAAVREAVSTTDPLTYDQINALLGFAMSLDRENITFATVPEYGGMLGAASVLIPDYDRTRALLDLYFSHQPLDFIGPPVPEADPEDPAHNL
ncbi:MAG: LCP family protein [bacterium]